MDNTSWDRDHVPPYTFLMQIYNQFHNILRLLDVLLNFPFTTSETMDDYYLLL